MLQNLTIDGTNIYDKFKIWVYKVDKVVDIPPLRSLDVHYWTENNIPDVAWELQTLDVKTYDIEFYAKDVRYLEYFIGFIGAVIVTGKQIGRASCRERVSSPV